MNRQFRHNNLASFQRVFSLLFFFFSFLVFCGFRFFSNDPPSTFRYSLAFRPISFYRLPPSPNFEIPRHIQLSFSLRAREEEDNETTIARCQLENYNRRAERMKFKPKNTIDACVCVYIDESGGKNLIHHRQNHTDENKTHAQELMEYRTGCR